MPRNNKRFFLQTIVFCLLIGSILFFNGNTVVVKAGTGETYKNLELFTEVLRQIEKNYVEPEDDQKLVQGAIKGMVQSLRSPFVIPFQRRTPRASERNKG